MESLESFSPFLSVIEAVHPMWVVEQPEISCIENRVKPAVQLSRRATLQHLYVYGRKHNHYRPSGLDSPFENSALPMFAESHSVDMKCF